MKKKTGSCIIVSLMFPVVISFWLLSAHFLRMGDWVGFVILLIFPLLLVIKRPLIVRIMQLSLIFSSLAWMQITYQMLMTRMMMGDDWQRLTVIMGGVICFTLLSACTFFHSRLEHHFDLK